MRPIRITRQLTLDANGIAEDQTTAGAANLVLDGALAQTITNKFGSVVEVPLGGRQITLESAANLSAVDFTITGRDFGGREISEVIAGPNANTVATVRVDWNVVTQIAVSAAVGTNVEVGVNNVGASAPVPLDQYFSPFNVSVGVTVVGTINATVQFTFDDIWNGVGPFTWTDHVDLTAFTANADGTFISPVSATRILNNSGDGTTVTNIMQAGVE